MTRRLTDIQIQSEIFPNRRPSEDEVNMFRDINRSVLDTPESKGENAIDYNGHFAAWAVVVETYDYYKSSGLSGDEVRKGGRVRLFCNGVQVWEGFTRSLEHGMRVAADVRGKVSDACVSLEDWPGKIGQEVYYDDIPAVITDRVPGQACVILKRRDGQPWKFEDDGQAYTEETIKVDVIESDKYWPFAKPRSYRMVP